MQALLLDEFLNTGPSNCPMLPLLDSITFLIQFWFFRVCAVGLFPFRSRISPGRLAMGYASVQVRRNCRLFPAGASLRGHFYQFIDVIEERAVEGLASMLNPSPISFEVRSNHSRVAAVAVGT